MFCFLNAGKGYIQENKRQELRAGKGTRVFLPPSPSSVDKSNVKGCPLYIENRRRKNILMCDDATHVFGTRARLYNRLDE